MTWHIHHDFAKSWYGWALVCFWVLVLGFGHCTAIAWGEETYEITERELQSIERELLSLEASLQHRKDLLIATEIALHERKQELVQKKHELVRREALLVAMKKQLAESEQLYTVLESEVSNLIIKNKLLSWTAGIGGGIGLIGLGILGVLLWQQ